MKSRDKRELRQILDEITRVASHGRELLGFLARRRKAGLTFAGFTFAIEQALRQQVARFAVMRKTVPVPTANERRAFRLALERSLSGRKKSHGKI